MSEIALYRVSVTKTYTLLAVGSSPGKAEDAVKDAIENGEADYEISQAETISHAIKLERLDQLGPDEREALPWGSNDDSKHCRDYVSP